MAKYKDLQEKHQIGLIEKTGLFDRDPAWGEYRSKKRPFVLENGDNNLWEGIREEAKEYFDKHQIGWWGGKSVPRHVLSSQVACVNHLFPLRNQPLLLKSFLRKQIGLDVAEMLPIPKWLDGKEDAPHYIAFEAISRYDHLNEDKLSRGANCTSVDAIMIAKMSNGEVVLLPIEWKYTESYNNGDKSSQDSKNGNKGDNTTGKKRIQNYTGLIDGSSHLVKLPEYQGSIYYQEPFYQLMRQTLWAEQVIKQEPQSWHNATKCVHVHFVPSKNTDLLNRNYKRFPFMDGLENTWRQMLTSDSQFFIIDPSKLYEDADDDTLKEYLSTRYWI